jgi:hypothetical protein
MVDVMPKIWPDSVLWYDSALLLLALAWAVNVSRSLAL